MTTEYEQQVIDTLLYNPKWVNLSELLVPEIFAKENQLLFAQIVEWQKEEDELPLHLIAANPVEVVPYQNQDTFLKVLKLHTAQLSYKRQRASLKKLLDAGDDMDPSEFQTALGMLNSAQVTHKTTTWSDAMRSAMEWIDTLDEKSLLSYTIPSLDIHCGGCFPGQLITIGARPGAFKTALAYQILMNASLNDNPAGFITTEMDDHELGVRGMAHLGKFSGQLLIKKQEVPLEKANKVMAEVPELPLYHGTGSYTPTEVCAHIRAWHSQYGIKIAAIDYLQRLRFEGSLDHRRIEVSDAANMFKDLAKELQIPIILIAQLSREVDKRDTPPIMSDLAESAGIEQHSDVVMFLWRRRFVNSEKQMIDIQQAILAKQRSGPCYKRIHLHMDGPTYTVSENFQKEPDE